MDMSMLVMPLFGGILIGLSASLLLLLQGRIFGVSGILGGMLLPKSGETAWRVASIMGLVTAGFVLTQLLPNAMEVVAEGPPIRYIIAGLLVGFGTQLGSGCTSGHGVCGISRMSPRSLLATMTFMVAGFLVVALMRYLGVIA
jgi:uncharacterized membrane protein YedE/YeeE